MPGAALVLRKLEHGDVIVIQVQQEEIPPAIAVDRGVKLVIPPKVFAPVTQYMAVRKNSPIENPAQVAA